MGDKMYPNFYNLDVFCMYIIHKYNQLLYKIWNLNPHFLKNYFFFLI